MYQAIVFLPLLGAIIAGLIAIVGARRQHPGGEPGADDHGHGTALHADEGGHHDDEGHAHYAPAPGSRPAEVITSGFVVIGAILSWIAFFSVGFGDAETIRVPVLNWFTSGTLVGDTQIIATYSGSTGAFTFASPFHGTPAAGDGFKILGRLSTG